jgi:hypothetical protein
MDRSQLRTLLAAGPSRRFSVLEATRQLEAARRSDELLFKTPFLNRAVFFKHLDLRARDHVDTFAGQDRRPVHTLIFLPYDPDRPGDGGEAMIYNRANLRRLHASRTNSSGRATSELMEDEAVLDVLDEMPALNPFLMRESFERAGRPLPEAYLTLDGAVLHRLQRRLYRRVRPLVLAAFGASGEDVGDALDNVVEAFMRPGKTGKLRQLGAALRVDPDKTPEVLGAWVSIAFFEDELARLKPSIHGFAHWLAHAGAGLDALGHADRRELVDRLSRLRASVRSAWREVRDILDAYQRSYNALVFEDDPQPFVAFLQRCRENYWKIGDLFGRFEQATHAWQRHTSAFGGGPLPIQLLDEFLRFQERTFLAGEVNDLLDLFQPTAVTAGPGEAPPLPRGALPF